MTNYQSVRHLCTRRDAGMSEVCRSRAHIYVRLADLYPRLMVRLSVTERVQCFMGANIVLTQT